MDTETAKHQVQLRPANQPGDLGWVVKAHGELYAAEYDWDTSFEALVARIVADYARDHDPAREAAWIAELGGERVGCIFCVADSADPTEAKLRLLLVTPRARGSGAGSQLVEKCIEFAVSAGYQGMALWTNDVLVAARRIYQRIGFELIEQSGHHSFGHDLTGQHWAMKLANE